MTREREDVIHVGIAGAAGRGGSFRAAFEANGARIWAVCDIREEALKEARLKLGAEEKYTDFAEMIERSDLDAVVIGTPMQWHVAQSVAALGRGLHVLSEVPAAISVEECRALVRACAGAQSGGNTGAPGRGRGRARPLYMMAENCCYSRQNVLVRELVRRGMFGEVYYAEGEYLHELKALNETTPWRRHWQTGIAGITYGTHSLGPILQWMAGDRVARVCCENTGSHYRDPRGETYAQDSATMLCKTVRGALIKVRVDMVSDRPHATSNFQLQGTDGAYESNRGGPGDVDKIWLRGMGKGNSPVANRGASVGTAHSLEPREGRESAMRPKVGQASCLSWPELNPRVPETGKMPVLLSGGGRVQLGDPGTGEMRWVPLEGGGTDGSPSLAEQYLPEVLRDPPPEALAAGHGGSDYYQILDFMRAIRGEAPCLIGIHEAMDMTLPGLVSQQSVLQGGAWLDVPDSREWV